MTQMSKWTRGAQRFVVTATCLLLMAGCAAFQQSEDAESLEDLTAEEIYQRAEFTLESGDGEEAASLFGEVERLYPYSELTRRALVMQAYSYHVDRDYEAARGAAERFLENYPADEDAPWAQYIVALSYYDQIDDVGRDQGLTFQALQALRNVLEGYPESEHARSAALKFDLAFDHLAAKEMEVGRYYLKRGHYLAAINRFRVVVEDFQTTSQTPEALHRLVESYLALGLESEAQTAGAILGHNFKGTEWYVSSYASLTRSGLEPEARGESWLRQVLRQTLRGEWI